MGDGPSWTLPLPQGGPFLLAPQSTVESRLSLRAALAKLSKSVLRVYRNGATVHGVRTRPLNRAETPASLDSTVLAPGPGRPELQETHLCRLSQADAAVLMAVLEWTEALKAKFTQTCRLHRRTWQRGGRRRGGEKGLQGEQDSRGSDPALRPWRGTTAVGPPAPPEPLHPLFIPRLHPTPPVLNTAEPSRTDTLRNHRGSACGGQRRPPPLQPRLLRHPIHWVQFPG